ncbi:hypothetical protein N7298_18580 [Aeromonas caviae]|uniref:acyltransferase n=1 Tax=Aeromonas caviae TaxID=648 RepID=UPI0024496290|nr:hypothetical protein [Aeromonas caviae]MDH0360786.1 hypothetical protein [Aeromonas caviae]
MNLEHALQKLASCTPGKLIESSRFYNKSNDSFNNITTFCSDSISGELKCTRDTGQENIIIRGHKSLVNSSTIWFSGKNNIVFLGPHSELIGADIRVTGNNCILYFGAFSTVGSMIVILSGEEGKIEVGDHCMLSNRIIIDRTDHHPIYDLATGLRINYDQDVTIGDHVWIGRDVRISKGSKIGDDAIIGQASLVTGNIKGSSVYGGIPARCIKEGITWSRWNFNSIVEMEESNYHQNNIKLINIIRERA